MTPSNENILAALIYANLLQSLGEGAPQVRVQFHSGLGNQIRIPWSGPISILASVHDAGSLQEMAEDLTAQIADGLLLMHTRRAPRRDTPKLSSRKDKSKRARFNEEAELSPREQAKAERKRLRRMARLTAEMLSEASRQKLEDQ